MLAAWRDALRVRVVPALCCVCDNVALCRCTQTALKTLHVFHRLMRECDTHLLQLVRAACPAYLYLWMSLWWD